jgi:hypothetical protein
MKYAPRWGGSTGLIPKNTKNLDAALELLRWYYLTEEGGVVRTFTTENTRLPAYTPAWSDPLFKKPSAYYNNQIVFDLWTTEAKKLRPHKPIEHESDIESELTAAFVTIRKKTGDPVQIIQKVADNLVAEGFAKQG